MVLPCGFVEDGPAGLPVGLQMIGAAFNEVLTLPINCTGLLVHGALYITGSFVFFTSLLVLKNIK